MPEAKSPRCLHCAVLIILTGLAAWGGTYFTLGTQHVAALWVANAIALSLMLRVPRKYWPVLLAAFGTIIALARSTVDGLSMVPFGLGVANMVEIGVAATLLADPRLASVERGTPSFLWSFVLRAGLLAPLASMPFALLALNRADISPFSIAQDWFIAHSLGMISVGSVLLSLNSTTFRALAQPRQALEAIAITVGVMLLTFFVFEHWNYPIKFLILTALVLAVFRLSFAGAAIALATCVITATLMANSDDGTIAAQFGDVRERVAYFQAFIAAATFTVLPIAALLEDRNLLKARAEDRKRFLEFGESVAHVGHWRVDSNSDETFWSDEVFRIHGLPVGQAHIKLETALSFFHSDDRARIWEILEHPANTGEPYDVTGRIIRPDGEIRHVRLRGVPEYRDGVIVGLFGIVQDITADFVKEAELIEARRQAEASARTKERFIATISHEIRTPMTGVMGMIELLRSDPTEAERAHYLETLAQSASVLMALLNHVLDLSKLSDRKVAIEAVDFELNGVIENTINLFQTTASAKGILLDLKNPAPCPTVVNSDPTRIAQVLSNLVSNAVKFTDDGTVSVIVRPPSADPTDILWTFEVRDTGIGIQATDIPRLFAPFEQLGAQTSARFGGTGLGLAISKGIVTAMGGSISVDSSIGKGTSFTVSLPLPPGSGETRIEGSDQLAVPRHPMDLLLAEDNAVNQLLVSTLLKRAGHSVTVVENGLEAVRAAAETRFDAIFMDMQMPEMDGIEATRTIRATGNPVPIIALTADASLARRQHYSGIGLSDFLAKPVSLARLQQSLAQLEAGATPEPRHPAAGPEAIDPGVLGEILPLVGEAKLRRLLGLLRTEAERCPPVIAVHLERGDLPEARRACHALRGAGASVGARALADACRAIEAGGTSPDLVAALIDAADRTVAQIDAICGDATITL